MEEMRTQLPQTNSKIINFLLSLIPAGIKPGFGGLYYINTGSYCSKRRLNIVCYFLGKDLNCSWRRLEWRICSVLVCLTAEDGGWCIAPISFFSPLPLLHKHPAAVCSGKIPNFLTTKPAGIQCCAQISIYTLLVLLKRRKNVKASP